MFSKRSNRKDTLEPLVLTNPIPSEGEDSAATLVNSVTEINGDVISSGVVQIDGKVEGNVQGKTVIINQSGWIVGTVKAKQVVIHGRFKGRLDSVRVNLGSNCEVDGELYIDAIMIDEGARFSGSVVREERGDMQDRALLASQAGEDGDQAGEDGNQAEESV